MQVRSILVEIRYGVKKTVDIWVIIDLFISVAHSINFSVRTRFTILPRAKFYSRATSDLVPKRFHFNMG